MKKKLNKSHFSDPLFKVENDKLEAQLEFEREKRRKQEYHTGGW
jgi:hypothetical protein